MTSVASLHEVTVQAFDHGKRAVAIMPRAMETSGFTRPKAEGLGAIPGGPKSPSQSAEMALIQRVRAGESDAFYELVHPYERAVFLAALGIVRNEADAEEVAQEAILKAFKNLARFRQEAKFSTWLIQIAINEAKMRLRKDRRPLYESIEEGKLGDDGDYIPRDFADWREIPSEALEQKQLRKVLTNALDSLPEKYRTILVLRDVQQLSINETAKILGLSEANVKTRLSRARLQMRDALAPGFDGAWRREKTYEKVRPF
jgi:RNA polymerase sigma-70 factor, ECF subfamily